MGYSAFRLKLSSFSLDFKFSAAESFYRLLLQGLDTTGADVKTLRDMVRHFQQLFDCPHLQGVYPRMNEVFSKLEESRNTINTFKDLLGLGTLRIYSVVHFTSHL